MRDLLSVEVELHITDVEVLGFRELHHDFQQWFRLQWNNMIIEIGPIMDATVISQI